MLLHPIPPVLAGIVDRRAARGRRSSRLSTADAWLEEVEILPIVVGIHIDAEIADRPLARRIVEAVRRWQHLYCDEAICRPVVISDALYLTTDELQRSAVISLGHPRVNAVSAALAERLPVVYSGRGRVVIQGEWNDAPARLCLWAESPREHAAAVDRLVDYELDSFLEAVASAPHA